MDLPYSTSKKNQAVKIRMGEGMAGSEPQTIVQCFDAVVEKFGDKPALHQKILTEVSSAMIAYVAVFFFSAGNHVI
jgi:hypothetical protein